MTIFTSKHTHFCIGLLLVATTSLAGPGAHGPNGEHFDGPTGAPAQVGSLPRIETATETFELVGTLHPDELSLLIDRFDTNAPVLGGALEVEANGIKAQAQFHAEHGDYSVTDKAMLQSLAAPGKHTLVFTLTAGKESDLLEATMDSGGSSASANVRMHGQTGTDGHAGEGDHDAEHGPRYAIWGAGAVAVMAVLAIIVMRRRSRTLKGQP